MARDAAAQLHYRPKTPPISVLVCFFFVFLLFFFSGGGERFGSHDRVLTLPGPAGSQEYILLLLFFWLNKKTTMTNPA
jgi:hypothetical protein